MRDPAYYDSSIDEFRTKDEDSILGRLVASSGRGVEGSQVDAWREEIRILKDALEGIDGRLLLEYDVPRLGSRIDAVVIANGAVAPVEFKVGEKRYNTHDHNQAWDYALDLKNFHEASRDLPIFPVLCATDAASSDTLWEAPHKDGVYPPIRVNANGVGEALRLAGELSPLDEIDGTHWGYSSYRPSPTIIEAARSLYSCHSVEAIARSDAGARNLHSTTQCVEGIIDRSKAAGEKSVVFITGVPGAGKTLVGLNIATQHLSEERSNAVFLSGNGPLVKVLREALVQDELRRQKSFRIKVQRKGEIEQKVKPFIQNVHHFRDTGVQDRRNPPFEHIAIFDEAQRAWDRHQTSKFMKQKKNLDGFTMSEPEFLLSYMDRHKDWAVVICLVGGGQEINTGEAGISAWLDAVRMRFPGWHAYISPELQDTEYAAGRAIEQLGAHAHIEQRRALHLSVSMRSFRAEQVSAFVKALLDGDEEKARAHLEGIKERYPIVLTRDRRKAIQWIREKARGNERYGMMASSQAQRLKAYCIDVRVKVDPVKYFLAERDDTRSSFYLEDAATEFQVQGLELDWTLVSWDADLRRKKGSWSHHNFRGRRWESVKKEDRQRYLQNAYRVLLTRARQGMAIFIPKGCESDHTIKPAFYDGTYEYLTRIGLPEL